DERDDLDLVVPLLIPPTRQRGRRDSTTAAARMLLGLEAVPGHDDWASQAAVADALGLTAGRLGQIGPELRRHWAGVTALRSIGEELALMVASNGGVVAVAELGPLLFESRGTGLTGSDADAAARAVIRAAIESANLGTGPRPFVVRRHQHRV